jgi:hypothetical protein
MLSDSTGDSVIVHLLVLSVKWLTKGFNQCNMIIVQEEFEKGIEGKRLEEEDWNDGVIKELQERLYSGDAGSIQDDQEANGHLQIDDRQGGRLRQLLLSFFLLSASYRSR